MNDEPLKTAENKPSCSSCWRRWNWAWVRLWLLRVVTGLPVLYLFGLVVYDGPGRPAGWLNWGLALLWIGGLVWGWIQVRARRLKWRLGTIFGIVALVLIPWLFMRPSNDREWKPDFAKTGWVEKQGDELIFHNYRDFTYRDDGSIDERWLTKTLHLSKLESVDLFFDTFGGDLAAHPIFSFNFGDEGRVVLSIEARREVDETFSVFGGLYKMYELQYLFGSERDFIGLRTNVRGEPVHFYSLRGNLASAREFLLDAVAAQNELRERPRFYNILTANCTSSLRVQAREERRRPLDWRMMINGRFDEYLFEQGILKTVETNFAKLREKSFLNEKAKLADWSTESKFSEDIRK